MANYWRNMRRTWWRAPWRSGQPPVASAALRAARRRQRESTLQTDEQAATPCGWFDSSWELRQGLAVIELRGGAGRRPAATQRDGVV